jgi:hypothetical protein
MNLAHQGIGEPLPVGTHRPSSEVEKPCSRVIQGVHVLRKAPQLYGLIQR